MEKKILIIEDNEQNIYLATFLLEHSGYKVLQARNGVDGVDMALQHTPDLVLMDLQLPLMDGFTATNKIRNNKNDIPVVAVTSFAMSGDREKILSSGFDGYIEKPIDTNTFIEEVERYIKKG